MSRADPDPGPEPGGGDGRPTLPLSVFVIARDEADRIGATIRAVRTLSDDVVVVDSGSRDATVEVARAAGARVVHHAWEGYGLQKRFAEEQCRHDWMLNLDADEVAPPALAGRAARPVRPAGRPRPRRLPDRHRGDLSGRGRAAPARLHAPARPALPPQPRPLRGLAGCTTGVEMEPGARIGRLRHALHHFSVRSLGDQVEKLNRYTDRQADDLAARGVEIPTWRLYAEFPAAFLKAYLGRRHAARGAYGFLTAMNYAISRHLRLAKHYERRRFGLPGRPDAGER